MTKEEVIAAILRCMEKLGRVPSRVDLMKHEGVSRRDIRVQFGSYMRALEQLNLEKTGGGIKVEMQLLYRDWAEITRRLKKIPTIYDYEQLSRYSVRPFRKRFGSWRDVPNEMKKYALEQGLADEWSDVLQLVDDQAKGQVGRLPRPAASQEPIILTDRPVYGPVIGTGPMICGPTNEQGVLFLFGALAEQLGFKVLRIQTGFPDCEAWRVVAQDRLQRVRIELELESRNFLRHGHDPKGCDLIVCWEHNWADCPLEVVELRKQLPKSPELPKLSI